MIIIDENVEFYWIHLLRSLGYEILSIAESFPGISDKKVIKLAKRYNGLLITEDKDFGELIFAHRFEKVAVIFLRYDQPQYNQIEKSILICVEGYYNNPGIKYFTVTKHNIRVRSL
nr:DUF5615 family PIN-like protein [Bacteroidota bacterium]